MPWGGRTRIKVTTSNNHIFVVDLYCPSLFTVGKRIARNHSNENQESCGSKHLHPAALKASKHPKFQNPFFNHLSQTSCVTMQKQSFAISQPLNFPRHFIPENPPFASSVPAVSLKSSVTSCRLLLSVRQFFNFENLKLGFQFWEFLEDQTSDICSAADRSVRKRIPRLPVDFLVLVYIGILSFLPTISTGDESHLVFPHLFSASLPLRNCLPTVERDHVYCSFSSLQTDSSSSPSWM